MQTVGHLLLHGGEARFHGLQHLRLTHGLRVGYRGDPPGQLLLPPPERVDGPPQLIHLVDQRLGRTCGARNTTQRKHQQDHDQHGQRRADDQRQSDRVAEVEGKVAKVHQVRPNSRSISESFSST